MPEQRLARTRAAYEPLERAIQQIRADVDAGAITREEGKRLVIDAAQRFQPPPSAEYCGCDAGAGWICHAHQGIPS